MDITDVLSYDEYVIDDSDTPQSRPHTSFSQLSTYLRCSMQYYYKYVAKQPDRGSLSMRLGSAGHAALEWNDRQKIRTGLDRPLPELLDRFSDHYDAETAMLEPDELKPGEDIGRTKDAAVEAVKVYHVKEASHVRPIMVEKEFDLDLMPLDNTGYPLKPVVGRIDLITTQDILDRKWTARMKSQSEVDMSYQLSLYELWFRMKYRQEPDNVGFQVFIPATVKKPAEVKTLLRSPEERLPNQRKARYRQLVHTMRSVQVGIDHAVYIPTNDPMKCASCPYRRVCQASLAKNDLDAIALLQKGNDG